MKKKDRERFLFHLGTLMETGFTIIDALEMSESKYKKDSKLIVEGLIQGKSFNQCIKDLKCFEKTDIEILRLSEETGGLTQAVIDLSSMYKQKRELNAKLISFAVYPAFMMSILVAYIFFAIFFMVPMMKDLLSTLEVSGGMIDDFDILRVFMIENQLLIIGLIPILIGVFIVIAKKFDLGLKIVLGSKYKLYRETATVDKISKLTMGGSNIMEIFDLIGEVKGINKEKIILGLKEGVSISESFGIGGFSKDFCSIIRINEESGNLIKGFEMYLKSSRHILKDVMEKRMKLIEPVSLVLIGGVVGISVISVMGPLTDAFTRIK
ncbi:MAG: type II secretion system F family protein [Clostridiaceae bacterium]